MRRQMLLAKVLVVVLALMMGVMPMASALPVYDPAFETLALDTGISMRYAVLGEEGKPALVLIHGATDSYYSYSQVAPELADAGYRVYVPELRGHGGTDKPNDGYYTLDQHTADISALIRALGLDRVYVVGHSLGSFVAQCVAAQPDAGFAVTGLTLIGTGAKTVNNGTLEWMLYGDGEFPGVNGFAEGVPAEFVQEWVLSSNEDPEFGKRTLEHAMALPAYSWINTFFGIAAVDQAEQLAKITCPVQIIWGSEDAFFSRSDQLQVIEALSASPDVELVTLAGASHNTHWDAGMLAPVVHAITGSVAAIG